MSSDEAQLGQVTFISSELWSAYLSRTGLRLFMELGHTSCKG